MMDHMLEQLLEQQLISQGGHQLFSLSLIYITLAMIIHDIVCLPLIYIIKSLSGTEIDGGIEQDNSLKFVCLSSQMIISGMSR